MLISTLKSPFKRFRSLPFLCIRDSGRLGSVWPTMLAFVLSCLMAGCGTVPKRDGRLRGPVEAFLPVKPGLVRLPVEITFPDGDGVVQHVVAFFKGGLQKWAPDWNALPGLHLLTRVTGLWAKMQEPIYLDKDFWLLVRPETLGVGRARSDLKRASTAHMVLEMTARPEIVFGPKPSNVPRPMPPLCSIHQGPGIFQATSIARFSYKEADVYFQKPEQKLIGKVVSGKGDRRFTLKGIRFYGSAGRVVVEARLSYPPPILNLTDHLSEMTLRLWGTPRFRAKQRVFDFPDLDFDVESGNILVGLAEFIQKSHLREEFRRLTRIPIGAKLDWMKSRIDLALNKPLGGFTRLKTHVDSFKVWGGLADKDGIEIRVSIKGTSTLEVTWN